MAVEFSKVYQVTVTFKYDDSGAIADDDLNPGILRAEIIERIGRACKISKGILQARPGSVTET